MKVIHDHDAGRSTVWHSTDLVALAAASGGVSALDAARALFDTDKPSSSEKEKARRRLEKLTRVGGLVVVQQGEKTTNLPMKWGRS